VTLSEYRRLTAVLRLLVDTGEMTPMGQRQMTLVLDEQLAATVPDSTQGDPT
jgi:hypothetical protein